MSTILSQLPHPVSLRWTEEGLQLLDQRRLPLETSYITCRSPQVVRDAIVTLAVRGAPAIGIAAAYGLYLGIRHLPDTDTDGFWQTLQRTAADLRSARPTAVNLVWALDRVLLRAETDRNLPLSQLKTHILEEAQAIQQEDAALCRQIGENFLPLLHDGMGILTHCNAGGLATAAYGTALAPLYLAKEKGWNIHVYADETRPVLQGSRLTAYELQQAGIDVTLICDNMAGHMMQQGKIQAVIVGTDRVAANGDVANKIGTYSLAVLAKAHHIPFYIAAPTPSIDRNTPTGDDIPIEERDAAEITHGWNTATAPPGVNVYNPAFDVTPANLITAIVTEYGVIKPPYLEAIAALPTFKR
ncbi:S-methyl-5-thioribose-1-phosphate isomerase [Desmospora activa]|uniref:Methylthioribose-1-phosphate isomerase n=1 Tax=Desmospora activa DSM 45169 TaxID=1121389 RepID=A0A2T4Z1Q9_9BACL|nr:S-methyl-5-thioribose-1-phosphate isomerase [Desmospora activa]PTM54693.1 methylthioribose-1-phosphate isomerase [Desmospora activa DSM 45169]